MAPLPFIIQVFFCFASCLFSTCFHPFCWKLPFVVLKKPGYATKEDALLVRVDRNGALKTSKYWWWWATSRGATVLGMRGLATSFTKQTRKLSSRHEVRCVCVFLMVCVGVFFVDFPSSIDKCWPQGKIKIHCLFLLVFSCPIDKDFLIQFLIVQRLQKS